MIAHHGGETSLLPALLASAGSLPVVLVAFRGELARLGRRFRRCLHIDNEKRGGGQ